MHTRRAASLPLFLLLVAPSGNLTAAPPAFADVRAFADTYCAKCHGEKVQKGGLNLAPFTDAKLVLKQPKVWQTVAEQLASGELEIAEGGRSLLDNTLLLYTSYMADGGHGTHDYPAVLVGKAAGTLKTGRHLAFKPRTPVSNLYAELLDRTGAKTTWFGENQSAPPVRRQTARVGVGEPGGTRPGVSDEHRRYCRHEARL